MNTEQKIIQNRIGLLNLAEELGNVSRACKVMGVSRDTFYRYAKAKREGGLEALKEATRRKPNLKNRVDEAVEAAVVDFAVEEPAMGHVRASNELRKRGVFVSPSGIRSIWLRHGLHTFKRRLKLLEAKMAEENLILTESQVAAMERKKEEQEAHGEIETEHPGYLGSQDTFYVGNLKGVGRVYHIKTRTQFPSDESVYKALYLALQIASKKWNRSIRNWRSALQQMAQYFEYDLSQLS